MGSFGWGGSTKKFWFQYSASCTVDVKNQWKLSCFFNVKTLCHWSYSNGLISLNRHSKRKIFSAKESWDQGVSNDGYENYIRPKNFDFSTPQVVQLTLKKSVKTKCVPPVAIHLTRIAKNPWTIPVWIVQISLILNSSESTISELFKLE